eukprot:TRINITY_DN29079_c0_g1_i1.p1 TRINITY_DN29079_c0_g1~~TRINITY_DN29079_c0_g1_i1.p1  ORF type:complete len:864 (+),score=110.05 TRINITY_DN29079_c0_g1_i1:59-2593(+)
MVSEKPHVSHWRWLMLTILSLDICVSYLPYYTFVPILRQSMQVYAVDEAALNVLCIIYALVYIPGAFLTAPIVSAIGCRWTFVLAMAFNVVGCIVRCGPRFVAFAPWASALPAASDAVPLQGPVGMPYSWLLLGQALCAMGQPLLVNSTSEMGAEWFPPPERPTAAMVSNLMNFVGSSLSFILPPLVVSDQPDNPVEVEAQMLRLLEFQLAVAVLSFLITFLLYRPAPEHGKLLAERADMSYFTEVVGILSLRDFWIVNGQFAIYVALGHAFDAVEGSLLEHYGYSAALCSWTGLACAIAAILSTAVESKYINDAKMYKGTLVLANGFMVISLLVCFSCLYFQMKGVIFVIGVAIMGLATPGWGCSCELGSEVCYPAREATVSSIFEAFSNLLGVLAIIVTQSLIDFGFGANVLLLMSIAAFVGASLLFGLTGRLFRSEAEAMAEDGMDVQDASKPPFDHYRARLPSAVMKTCAKRMLPTRLQSKLTWITVGVVYGVLQLAWLTRPAKVDGLLDGSNDLSKEAPLPGSLGSLALPSVLEEKARSKSAKARGNGTSLSRGSVPEPANYVLNCEQKSERFERFKHAMDKANLTFETVACAHGSVPSVEEAVREGLLAPSAMLATEGRTRQGLERSTLVGIAISHLRLLHRIAHGQDPVANIFEDTEVVYATFRARRNLLLRVLPLKGKNDRPFDFVNLNALRASGDKVFKKSSLPVEGLWMHNKVFRMKRGLSPFTNGWIGNYVVTREGARKLLRLGHDYDTFGKWESFDMYLLSNINKKSAVGGSFRGYTVMTNVLSVHCESEGYSLGRKGAMPRARRKLCGPPPRGNASAPHKSEPRRHAAKPR